MTRLLTTDEEDVMPPKKKTKRPTKEQIELLKKWIASGADAFHDGQSHQGIGIVDAIRVAGTRRTVDGGIDEGTSGRSTIDEDRVGAYLGAR